MLSFRGKAVGTAMNLHHLAEERSLAYHALIADKIERDPALLDVARRRVAEWLASGTPHAHYARAWSAILESPVEIIRQHLLDPTPAGRALRQVTPFAGMIAPNTRWKLWREVRERFSGD